MLGTRWDKKKKKRVIVQSKHALKDQLVKKIPKVEVCPQSGNKEPRKQIIFVEDKKKLTPSFKRNLAEILSERDAISKVIRRKSWNFFCKMNPPYQFFQADNLFFLLSSRKFKKIFCFSSVANGAAPVFHLLVAVHTWRHHFWGRGVQTPFPVSSCHHPATPSGSRTKLLPYTNFYVEVLTQFWIKLLHVEVLTKVWIKLLHIEVLTIFLDKTSTLTK